MAAAIMANKQCAAIISVMAYDKTVWRNGGSPMMALIGENIKQW